MRYIDLIEAPIQDIEVIGDPPEGKIGSSSIVKRDVGPLTSQKGVQKIKDVYNKVPYNFNFYVVAANARPKNFKELQNGVVTPEEAAYLIGNERVEKRLPDSITVIFTNNVANERTFMPMNAWILAHRISHNLQIANISHRSVKEFDNLESHLFKILITQVAELVGVNLKETVSAGYLWPRYKIQPIVQRIFTMRSAREEKLQNPIDYAGELIAQYLFTGRIKFNQLRLDDFPNAGENIQAANQIIKQSELILNNIVAKLFDALKGNILLW